jgi:hypothetical protein
MLFAVQTSLSCDRGLCNTAVVVPTVCAREGVNYLGWWATSLGEELRFAYLYRCFEICFGNLGQCDGLLY